MTAYRNHDSNEINYYIDQLISSKKYNPSYYQNKLEDIDLDIIEYEEFDE